MSSVEDAVARVRRQFMGGDLRMIACIKLIREVRRSSLMQAKKEVQGWELDRQIALENDYPLDLSKTEALEPFLPSADPSKAAEMLGKSLIAYRWRKSILDAKMLLELAAQGWIRPAEIVFPVGDEEVEDGG